MATARVLIVDDDPDFAEGLADVLIAHGCEVALALSGEQALANCQDSEFDLTFMDVRLPGKNGVESFLELRQTQPNARVIMMTGYGVERLLEQATEGGIWAVLHKPLDPTEVLRLLDEIRPADVLIADDAPDSVEGIRDLLAGRGFRIHVARDGQDAVERIRGNRIDVLILDLRMPVLSGLAVYQELQRTGHTVPTIVVTAYAVAEAEALEELRTLSVGGVLHKPFDPKELIDLVESLVVGSEGET